MKSEEERKRAEALEEAIEVFLDWAARSHYNFDILSREDRLKERRSIVIQYRGVTRDRDGIAFQAWKGNSWVRVRSTMILFRRAILPEATSQPIRHPIIRRGSRHEILNRQVEMLFERIKSQRRFFRIFESKLELPVPDWLTEEASRAVYQAFRRGYKDRIKRMPRAQPGSLGEWWEWWKQAMTLHPTQPHFMDLYAQALGLETVARLWHT